MRKDFHLQMANMKLQNQVMTQQLMLSVQQQQLENIKLQQECHQHVRRRTNAPNEAGFSLADGKYEVAKLGHDTVADVICTTATGKHQTTTGSHNAKVHAGKSGTTVYAAAKTPNAYPIPTPMSLS